MIYRPLVKLMKCYLDPIIVFELIYSDFSLKATYPNHISKGWISPAYFPYGGLISKYTTAYPLNCEILLKISPLRR